MFVNREKEIRRLVSALQKKKSQLIIVYGRRRCGKSALLRRVLSHGALYFAADTRETTLQIKAFAGMVGQVMQDFDRVIYPDWESILLALNRAVDKQTTVCIDEFPYLVKNSPELPSVLQRLRDEHLLPKLHLLLCGSSQQMMRGISIDSRSPLYGRCDEIMRIHPMGVKELQTFLQLDSAESIREYSVWGGVPRYWEIRATSPSLAEAISHHVFDQQGILHEEPERLFIDDMRTSVQAWSVLSLIAGGCHRLSEISARLQKPATHLSQVLHTLIELRYIRRDVPFGSPARSAKKSLYKVHDPFLDFYFRFLVPNKSLLAYGLIDMVWQSVEKQLDQYVSQHWEEVCRRALPFLDVDGTQYLPASRWWGTGTDKRPLEADVVAESANGESLLIGEVKWTEKPRLADVEKSLNATCSHIPFAINKTIRKAIFLKKKPAASYNDILLFDAHDIVRAV